MKLENLSPNALITGIIPSGPVTVISTTWFGQNALELTYKEPSGRVGSELLYRDDEARLEVLEAGKPWSFDGNGDLFRLVSEARRIRLAHLFDPLLAVHTSQVEPLPHQITAVYEEMLPRQPLRFLLADDPGAGKTIMAGLLIKELIARGDVKRCLVVSPGSLVEQWQDELYRRFGLPFDILTNDGIEAARTGNWFLEHDLVIARLDKLARDEDLHQKLAVPEAGWDLVIVDEAHKMSATFFGGEVKYTKRYRLGQLLGGLTRHLLLMTATPHNGKDEDFQLFMALLDSDRFEGRFRDGVHQVDVSDLMRRMVKEKLVRFDGRPLFPERRAHTVPYRLSDDEARLYQAVTDYVREEFNRAEALENERQAGTVGFALTILQRRLASSPAAILSSLRRRRERLESRQREVELFGRVQRLGFDGPLIAKDDFEDLEDAPESEVETLEAAVLDQATAARTVEELRAEIATLRKLEALAQKVYHSSKDTKWRQLSSLLDEIFSPGSAATRDWSLQPKGPEQSIGIGTPEESERPQFVAQKSQKLVIFTEHRDTLEYLRERVTTQLGRTEAVVTIHGGIGREQRLHAQESFRHDPDVQVLIATDAAGEGINLQRAHLMVNYDLPWNPNRLEQRFGRIHRIGQTEVCHLWNLVAQETREGDVYQRLLEKLAVARDQLGGQVFDVLGRLQFEGKPLRELLVEAIRYGEQPEVRARLDKAISEAVDQDHLQDLLEERALVTDSMDASRITRIREEMERAEARRLQPHYVEAFFLEAFKRLGGTTRERESRRYEASHVPAVLRRRDRLIGTGEPVLQRYERIAFEKDLIQPAGQTMAAFVTPGHPLLNATLDLTLERYGNLLKQGSVLVDERDDGYQPRVLVYLEHAISDASLTAQGERRTISRRMLYVEIDQSGVSQHLNYAPYLDYRPLRENEPAPVELLDDPAFNWISADIEKQAMEHAVSTVVPDHLQEVRTPRLAAISKTRSAVKERLTKEITHWDSRAEALKLQEQTGRKNARLNSQEARRRADELEARLSGRLEELARSEQISAQPPVVIGAAVVVPGGLIRKLCGQSEPIMRPVIDTQVSAARARAAVMQVERELGYHPVDREFERLGYDVESKDPVTGRLRFIEVKGRVSGADAITVTKNEVMYALNKPDDYILAIVEFHSDDDHSVHYIRNPFEREPDFGVTSTDYSMRHLLAKAERPS